MKLKIKSKTNANDYVRNLREEKINIIKNKTAPRTRQNNKTN